MKANRSAFTLIETLLALGLSSALLLVVFSLADSTATYHITGTDQVLASQRLIGVLQDLRFDVRAVSLDPSWDNRPQAEVDFEEHREELLKQFTSQIQLQDLQKSYRPIQLAGSRDWLMLTLAHANPRLSGSPSLGLAASSSGMNMQVVWALGGSSLTVATHDEQGKLLNRHVALESARGLTRTVLLPVGNKLDHQLPQSISDATACNFRYFAQGKWKNSWNSTEQKKLPDGVEVTVQFRGDAAPRVWFIMLPPADRASAEAQL